MNDRKVAQISGLIAVIALELFHLHNRNVLSTNALYLWVVSLGIIVLILQIWK